MSVADDNTIGGTVAGSGNVISGNNDGSAYVGAQIYIPGNDNLVEGNLIGLGADGDIVTVPVGDLNAGVSFQTGGQNFIGSHNTIGGVTAAARNVISGNQSNIILQGGSYNLIEGNYIGTDTTGTIAIGPGPNGTADLIDINTESTVQDTIGGTTTGARNIISGASQAGLYFGAGTSESVVEGNYIGTDKTGTLALPNGTGFQEGDEGSPGDNTIGGATSTPGTGAGNLIAGNQGSGISIGQGDGDVVEGNAIGVVALPGGGTSPANRGDGIEVGGTEGAGVQIGGPSDQDQNVISGNTNDGIEINGSSGVLVEGNLIGTDITGKLAVPNALASSSTPARRATRSADDVRGGKRHLGQHGRRCRDHRRRHHGQPGGGQLHRDRHHRHVGDSQRAGVELDTGATGNTIGGTTTRARNIISGNTGEGVVIDAAATGNVVAGNYIGTDITGTNASARDRGLRRFGQHDRRHGLRRREHHRRESWIESSFFGVADLDRGRDNLVAGNFIGLNRSGVPLADNTSTGLFIVASGNTIGGTTAGARNVISGNYTGISSNGDSDTVIEGNYIGTDPTGTVAIADQPFDASRGRRTEGNRATRAEAAARARSGGDARPRRASHDRDKQLEEQLRQSQKMEAVGQLAGGVAHDFNNLLTVITDHSVLLQQELPDEQAAAKLKEIEAAAHRAATLTGQLLAFSRKQVVQPRIISVNTVVAGVEELLRRLIGDHISVLTVSGSGLGAVKVDPGQLEMVIMNLAVNARDAMPDGGRLPIETGSVNLAAGKVPPLAPGTYVTIGVAGTGHGMDSATTARIFEPFFTTKPIGKGTGLGLSTARGIAEQCGGTLTVESSLGKGTTFRMYIPVAIADTAAESDGVTVERAPEQTRRASASILIVEDHPPLRELISTILNDAGYKVLEAANGAEALRLAEQDSVHLLAL